MDRIVHRETAVKNNTQYLGKRCMKVCLYRWTKPQTPEAPGVFKHHAARPSCPIKMIMRVISHQPWMKVVADTAKRKWAFYVYLFYSSYFKRKVPFYFSIFGNVPRTGHENLY